MDGDWPSWLTQLLVTYETPIPAEWKTDLPVVSLCRHKDGQRSIEAMRKATGVQEAECIQRLVPASTKP